MEKRVADIIADCIFEYGIKDVFSLVGGGAMFLNDALGHHKNIKVTYMQHEQACSMAAEGYVRCGGEMAAVCVTTGPGGTNAITGVLGAYQDNYPMLILSGQVRLSTTVCSTGLNLRFMGEQEHDIVSTVKNLTKYAVMIKRPEDVLYEVEKAIYLAKEGRPGPTWVDVPMDIQSMTVDVDTLRHYEVPTKSRFWNIEGFIDEIKKAERPVILAGSAMRSIGYVDKFRSLVNKMGIPVIAATYNGDILPTDFPLYFGNFGIIGGRAGNTIVQNADLIIGMGCRMTYRQIGFNYELFSPNSRHMVIDVDEEELKKPTLRIDVPICADIRDVIDDLLVYDKSVDSNRWEEWIDYCIMLREKYPQYLRKFDTANMGQVNPYYFGKEIKKYMSEESIIVLGNSTIASHIIQLGIDKPKQRIINNMNLGSMGYDIPAAIGAARAKNAMITLITGDGSIMLNLQELETIVHYGFQIKIFICSNGGYRGIVRSQSNMFGHYTGCTKETGVEMPDFGKIAEAFNIPYYRVDEQKQLDDILEKVYRNNDTVICEWPQDPNQLIEPKIMNRRTKDGGISSTAIDDMFPFLAEEEYNAIQYDIWKLNK